MYSVTRVCQRNAIVLALSHCYRRDRRLWDYTPKPPNRSKTHSSPIVSPRPFVLSNPLCSRFSPDWCWCRHARVTFPLLTVVVAIAAAVHRVRSSGRRRPTDQLSLIIRVSFRPTIHTTGTLHTYV